MGFEGVAISGSLALMMMSKNMGFNPVTNVLLISARVVSRPCYCSDWLAVVVDGKYVRLLGVNSHGDPGSWFGQKNARNACFQFHVAVIGGYDEGNQGRATEGTCAGNDDTPV